MQSEDAIWKPSTSLRILSACIYDPRDFVSLFAEHHTILAGSLRLILNVYNNDLWMALMDTFDTLSNIQYLELFCSDKDTCDAAAVLVSKMPGLTELNFTYRGAILGNDLASAVTRLPNLQELTFDYAETDDQGMQDLFQGLAAKGKESTLRKVDLQCDPYEMFPIANILASIPDIPTLQDLSISSCKSISPSMIDRCFRRMEFHPSIEAVELQGISGVTDVTLKHLAAIKHLKHVNVHLNCGITEQDLVVFEDTGIVVK